MSLPYITHHNTVLWCIKCFTNCLRWYPEGTLDREIPTSPTSPFLFTLPRWNLSCHSNPYQIKALHEFSGIEEENGQFQKCWTFSIDSDQWKVLRLMSNIPNSAKIASMPDEGNWNALNGLSGPPSGVWVGQLLESCWVGGQLRESGEKRAIEWSLQLLITQATTLSPLGDKQVSTSNQKYPNFGPKSLYPWLQNVPAPIFMHTKVQ